MGALIEVPIPPWDLPLKRGECATAADQLRYGLIQRAGSRRLLNWPSSQVVLSMLTRGVPLPPYMLRYKILEGDLVALDIDSGQPVWIGKPDGRSPQEVLPIPNSDDCIVLVDWATSTKLANLIRITPQGGVTWRAELPKPPGDAYTEMDWSRESLTAYSWSGYLVTIDPETGTIQNMEFGK